MPQQLVGGKLRDVVWTEERDNGGMFTSTVGVSQDERGFIAYVNDWGGGIQSRHHQTLADARDDIDRLWGRLYGEE